VTSGLHRAHGGPLCLRLLLQRFHAGERDLQAGLVFLVAGVVIIAGSLAILIQLPQVPYNVRELFAGRHLALSLPLFAAFLIWTASVPNLMARITIICPMLHLAQPLTFLLMASPSWFLLQASVSTESLIDILGTPVLGWSGNWELFVRYLALCAPFLLSVYYWNLLLEGRAWLNWPFGAGHLLGAMLLGLPMMWLSKYLVADQAATQNILALSAQGPFWKIGGSLVLVIALIALNGVLLAWAWLWSWGRRLLVLAFTPLLLLLSWWFLTKGLRTEAFGFLLGPDQSFQASELTLLLRWSLVYGAAAALIAFAHLIPFRLRGSGAVQREALSAGTFPHHVRQPATNAVMQPDPEGGSSCS